MAQIKARQMSLMFRRTSAALAAGVDARRVWRQEAERGSLAQRSALSVVSQGIDRGATLAASMNATNGFFPQMAVDLIDVGEKTGQVESVLSRLADHYDHLVKARRTFWGLLTWPAIELGLTILFIGLLIWVMGILPGDMDILGFGLMGTSGLLIYLTIVGLIAGAIYLGVQAVVRGWLGEWPLKFALRIPVVGECLKTMALSRLAWVLGMTLDTGADARYAMQMAIRSTNNPHYTNHAEEADAVLARGGEFHESLRVTGAFPDEFLDSLEAAELSGTHSDSMLRLSNELEQRARDRLTLLSTLASVGIGLLIAALIIFLIMRIFIVAYIGPIYDSLNDLNAI